MGGLLAPGPSPTLYRRHPATLGRTQREAVRAAPALFAEPRPGSAVGTGSPQAPPRPAPVSVLGAPCRRQERRKGRAAVTAERR